MNFSMKLPPPQIDKKNWLSSLKSYQKKNLYEINLKQ